MEVLRSVGVGVLLVAMVAAAGCRDRSKPAKAKAEEPVAADESPDASLPDSSPPQPKAVTFSFAPPEELSYIQNVRWSKSTRGRRSCRRSAASKVKMLVTIKRTDKGYRKVEKWLSMKRRYNGKKLKTDPMTRAMIGSAIVGTLDKDGRMLSAKVPTLRARLKKLVPRRAYKRLGVEADLEAIKDMSKTEHNARVAGFVGKRFVFGETVEIPSQPFILADTRLTTYQVTRVDRQKTSPCDHCVRVLFKFKVDSAELKQQWSRLWKKILRPTRGKGKVTFNGKIKIWGTGSRVIDPSTMLVQKENHKTVMKLVPKRGQPPVTYTVKRQYTFTYQR